MIELALCLGVIAFALVAIIGVMPAGINVQKDNREETIINQDGMFWMEAIRSGSTGLDNLTNHVDSIRIQGLDIGPDGILWETRKGAPLPLRTGAQIIGLVSLPTHADVAGPLEIHNWPRVDTGTVPNRITAKIRAISGNAVEKAGTMQDFAFTYIMIPEVRPIRTLEDLGYLPDSKAQARVDEFAKSNFYEIKLTFRWPVFPRGNDFVTGNRVKVFKTLVAGRLVNRNLDPRFIDPFTGNYVPDVRSPFFFFEPLKFSTPEYAEN